MRYLSNLCILAVLSLVAATALPAFSQQVKGDSELGLNGEVLAPHSSPGDALGLVQISYGYYVRSRDLLGVDSIAILSKTGQDIFLQGRYRHLFSTSNPRVFPFVGAASGVNIMSGGGSSTTHNGLGTGEAGVKFFVSQRSAFEVAYNLQYVNTGSGGFSDNTFSVITFGFTHLFGGHR